MRLVFALLLAFHGAVHLAGFAKGWGLAEMPQLVQPISRTVGTLWLVAGLLFLASAGMWLWLPRHWWATAAPALLLSQALIVADFSDARLGTIANAIILVPLLLALADLRPSSLRSLYQADVRRQLALLETGATATGAPPPVSEADLAPLPAPVATYLRRAGVVGKPHLRGFQALFKARIRNDARSPWMDGAVEQHTFFGPTGPARLFFMTASRWGIPFVAYHRYVGEAATMQIRLAGLVDVVDARGPEMNQSETVTMLNDLCFFAPAALLDAPVTWQALDDGRVKATFSNAGNTISALLTFDAAGDLVGFASEDRYHSDGKTHRRLPWSTPLSGYRDVGDRRLPMKGEARWRDPTGEWAYAQLDLERIDYR